MKNCIPKEKNIYVFLVFVQNIQKDIYKKLVILVTSVEESWEAGVTGGRELCIYIHI